MAAPFGNEKVWHKPGTRGDADDLARRLTISRAKLALTIGVHPSALSRDKLSAATQIAFDPLLDILERATRMAGDEQRAVLWFNHYPIIPLGTLPAIAHGANGNADDVMEFMELTQDGVYS
ncbi:hypothetical protein [Qipengyuania qiaonensis]|uniref:DUF2384 domain-containing protein n=1 Tax=Qipengyuania qiaonensis TaxID=2867240 RepID=A0ABS7J909_9SPHN|nr:hypothetical protein [Qipengyuania qiaonensis]MBX7483817.1 hypothetical protein [Qipengyuania qiaonensis]